jgi:hypothetical protein
MSDKPIYDTGSHTINLRVWALGQMVWGAFLAGLFVVLVGGTIFALYLLGLLLPEESKQAPSPYGSLIEQPLETGRTITV